MQNLLGLPLFRDFVLLLLFLGSTFIFFRALIAAQNLVKVRRDIKNLSPASGLQSANSELLGSRNQTAWSRIVTAIEASGLSLGDTKPDALRKKLLAAGIEAPDAPRIYTLIRLVLIVLLPLMVLGGLKLGGVEIDFFQLYLAGAFFGLLGLFFPELVLRIRADRPCKAAGSQPPCTAGHGVLSSRPL